MADNESVSTPEDTPIDIDILDGDIDLDGTIDPTSVLLEDPANPGMFDQTSVTIPGQGTFEVDPATGGVTFTPEPGYNGPVTPVNYSVADDDGATDIATIFVGIGDVNDPPVADDESETTPEDTPVTIDVLAGDTDSDGTIDPTSVQIIDPVSGAGLSSLVVPGEGAWVVDPMSGEITFTPEVNYNGPVTPITYSVADDDGATDTATVTVVIEDVNDPPTADNEAVTTDEDTPVTIDVLDGDADLDGMIDPTSVQIIDPVSGASVDMLVVVGEGTWVIDPVSGEVTFTPEPEYNGPVTPITYSVADDDGATATALVEVTINDVNDPPVADNESETTPEDTPVTIDVLAGDTDSDGTINPASVEIIDPVTGGGVTSLIVTGEGTWTVEPDGQITFTPEANYNGCLLYTSPSPRDATLSRMPSSA